MGGPEGAAHPLVVLVDDEPNIRETLSFMLEMEGFAVATAEDGRQGLALAQRLRPPVMLLDAMLPQLDGFSVCRQLKADDATASTRVIMLTALGQRTDRDRAFAAGADFYVSKPFDEDELLALLHRLTAA
ncbi:MAG: response regulator transcription factor [Thermoanaerobaculaceae bacterium]